MRSVLRFRLLATTVSLARLGVTRGYRSGDCYAQDYYARFISGHLSGVVIQRIITETRNEQGNERSREILWKLNINFFGNLSIGWREAERTDNGKHF